jgi:hypothetical protein
VIPLALPEVIARAVHAAVAKRDAAVVAADKQLRDDVNQLLQGQSGPVSITIRKPDGTAISHLVIKGKIHTSIEATVVTEANP